MLRKTGKKCLAVMVSIMLMTGALGGCGGEKVEKMSTAIHVEVQTAEPGRLEIKGRYMGTVSPNESVNVTPMASGLVKKVLVKEGDRVKKGDVLCRFDDTAASLSLKSAKGAVDSAKAGKNAAKAQQKMAAQQSAASISALEETLDSYEKSLKSAKQQLKQMESSQKQMGSTIEQTQKAVEATKKQYKTAQALRMTYQSFLDANPDCKTTAGLIAASGDTTQAQKAKTAAALLETLNTSGLTVEHLDDAGLNMLKENVEDAETAYMAAVGAYSVAQSGMSSLQKSIDTLKGQIKSAKSSLKSAKKAPSADSGDGDAVYDAQIRSAQAGVDSARYQKDLCTVAAPIDGVVEAVGVSADEMYTPGMPAFVIAGKDSILVTFYVTEEVRDYLRAGDVIEAEHNGKTLRGTISSIAVAADAQRGLFKVEAQIYAGEEAPATGVSVALSVVTAASEEKLLVPYDAVYYENNQAYVYCVQDGKAIRTDVETGLYDEETIAIESGLTEGASVIVSWASGLKDGAEISDDAGKEKEKTTAAVQDDSH